MMLNLTHSDFPTAILGSSQNGQRNIEGRPFVVRFERFRNSLRKEHPGEER